MSDPYPLVPLGDMLHLDLNKIQIDPSAMYEMAGVLSFGRGLFRREPVHGGNTSYKFFYRLNADHIVMSQLFGWEGALALSSAEFAGLYVSPQFPTFRCNAASLDRQFLGWLMQRPAFWEDLGTRTKGMGDRRRTLNPNALFSVSIPLPPLAEQRRIVARIETLAAKITEARGLRQQATTEADNLPVVMAHRPDIHTETKLRSGWREVAIGDVVKQVQDPVQVDPAKSYPNLGIYSFGRGLFAKPPIEGLATSANVLYRVQSGQFIYSRLFAFEGSYGRVSDEFDGCFVSGEYPTFACDPGSVNAEFLYAYFKAPHIWSEVAMGSKGLGDRRQRVQPNQVIAHRLLLPPMEWQREIVTVQAQVDAVRRLQAETAAALTALLPAVLDRAFRGKL